MRNLAVMIVALGMMFGYVSGSQAQETAPEIKQWDFTYDGNALPAVHPLWNNITAEVKDGILHLAYKGAGPIANASCAYYWKAISESEATVEARVKVVFCKDKVAVHLGVANGSFEDWLTLYEDRIELENAKLSYPMDTTADFHTYRITIKDKDIKVYVDGKLGIDGSGKFTEPAYAGRNYTLFGVGTSFGPAEAYWDWVRYVAGAKTEKGTVKVEKTQILFESEEDVFFPCASMRFGDGTIWTNFFLGQHMAGERILGMMSADDGKTWKLGGVPDPLGGTWVGPDGRIMRVVPEPLRGTVFPLIVERWDNHQSTKAERIKSEVALPFAVGTSLGLARSLIRTADGKLIAPAYGRVTGEPRDRVFCITSNDDGKTWKFLSTIAYDPKKSYNEMGLERLANGDLLCLMRTEGETSPLMQTRSIDGGKTWEVPHEVWSYGVAPTLKLLSSGILVSTFGRPSDLLMVDFDGTGEEWDALIPYYKGPGCGYTNILELEPNLIMVLYTESSFLGMGGKGPLNRLMAAYIRLEKR